MSREDHIPPLSSGDKVIDAAIAEAVAQPLPTLPVELEDSDIPGVYRAGLKAGFYVEVTFEVADNVEVQVDNPLETVPRVHQLATLVDRDRTNIYMDAEKPGAVDPCTWTEDVLGFKCNVDTSTEPLTVLIYIE